MVFEEDWARKRYGDEVEKILFVMQFLEKEIWASPAAT
jgi:hypothetical protein